MSTDASNLLITITGDSSSAVEAADVSQESMDALTAAIGKLTESFGAQAASSDMATAGLDRVGASAAKTAGLSDGLTKETYLLSRGFQTLGFDAGAAATRVGALGDVLARFSAVNPVILAVVAALTALFGAFEFFKTGVEEADKVENSMMELRIAVENAGGSFTGVEQKVRSWGDSLALVSGIASSQSIPMMEKLVIDGQSVAGSMSEVTIATQAVAAGMGMTRGATDGASDSTRRLALVMRALLEAQDGSYTALGRIDSRLMPLIEHHASLSQIMEKLNEDTKNAVIANDSNAMAWARVRGAMSATSEAAGRDAIPAMEAIAHALFAVVIDLDSFNKAAHEAMDGFVQAMIAAGHGANDFASLIGDAFVGNWAAVHKDMGDLAKDNVAAMHAIGTGWQGVGKMFYDAFHPATVAANAYNAALKNVAATAADTSAIVPGFSKDPKAKSGPGPGAVPGAADYETENATNRTQQQSAAERDLAATTAALDAAQGRYKDTEAQLAENVKLATTVMGEYAAKQALSKAQSADANEQVALITQALGHETSARDALAQQVANDVQTVNADTAAQTAHNHALAGSHKESLATREMTSQYAAAVHDATAQLADDTAALNKYIEAIKAHNQALADAILRQIEYGHEVEESLDKTKLKWDEFTQKQITDQADASAKQHDSIQQLIAYYRQQYQADYEAWQSYAAQKTALGAEMAQQYESLAEHYQLSLNQELNTLYQQDYNNKQQWLTKSESSIDTFLTDVLTKHKTLESELKTVYDQILQDFISMCIKMMAESSVVQNFLKNALGGIFGGGSGSSGLNLSSIAGGVNTGGLGGLSPSASGGGGASSTIGKAASALGGGSAGGAGAASSAAIGAAGMGALGLGGAGGSGVTGAASGSDLYGSLAGGNGFSPGGASSLVPRLGGSAMVAGMGGAMGGEMLAKMMYGNAPNASDAEMGGELGGAAGGILGSMLTSGLLIPALSITGPLGIGVMAAMALIGALAGGGIGSLFGDHFSQSDEPDIYQQQLWGQELADLQGSTGGDPMIANGKNFTMDSWTSSQTQGKGWNILMEQFVQKFRQNTKTLPQELQGGFAEIEKLWGGATNTADFNSNGKNGMLQVGSGEMAEWTTFWQYVSAYGPAVAQLMSQYTTADLYAASLNGSVSQMGGYTPGGSPWLIHNFPDVGAPNGAGGAPEMMQVMPGGSKRTVTNININQQFGGSSIADANMKNYIVNAIARLPAFANSDLNSP